jgi:hypothetical protein
MIRKQISLLAALWLTTALAGAQPVYSHLDTLASLPPRYHVAQWYDRCEQFLSDTVRFIPAEHCLYSMINPVCNRVVAVESATDTTLHVVGLAALVAIEVDGAPDVSLRAPEHMYLLQGTTHDSAYVDGDPSELPLRDYYTPHNMIERASLRWDTATPYVLKMPRRAADVGSADDSSYYFCYVYEAYFDSAVAVDSVFYIIGTFHSNGVNENAENPFYRYYPTAYFSIRQQYGDRCDRCRNLHFLYSNPSYPPNKNYWAILNDGIFMTPCLLPIVEVQDE